MPSSISSSSDAAAYRVPEGRWGRTWVVALVLTLMFVLGLETFWRSQGYGPSYRGQFSAWAREREKVAENDPRSVVFLGSSEIQAAVDLDLFAERTDLPKPIQLALTGSSPQLILEDLASDESFVGIAIAEINRYSLFSPTRGGDLVPQLALDHWRKARVSPQLRIEDQLTSIVNGEWVIRRSVLSPEAVVRSVLEGHWPRRDFLTLGSDRSLEFDYSGFTAEPAMGLKFVVAGGADLAVAEEIPPIIDRFEAAVAIIQARGGTVAIVAIDCTGPLREEAEKIYPWQRFWEPLEKRTQATVIDLRSDPVLAALQCPDGIHLAREERAALTEALAQAVQESILEPRRRGWGGDETQP